MFAKYEQEMQDNRNEIIEIKKTLTVHRTNNERLRDENEAYKSQNEKYLTEISAMEGKTSFDEEMKNKMAIQDCSETPEAL